MRCRFAPNDLGLFDMHGNVWTWCQERYQSYAVGIDGPSQDKEDLITVTSKEFRVLRGGSFYRHPTIVRSGKRYWDVPLYRFDNVGFRPARTFH
jgi:formylglycine-generating enzyme required for sulfatase activity